MVRVVWGWRRLEKCRGRQKLLIYIIFIMLLKTATVFIYYTRFHGTCIVFDLYLSDTVVSVVPNLRFSTIEGYLRYAFYGR